MPEIVDKVKHISVYHRSPHWVITRADRDVPIWRRYLNYLPLLQPRVRAMMHDLREDFQTVFDHNKPNYWRDAFRDDCLQKIDSAFPSNSERDVWLRKELTPNYEVGCKRVCVSDDYFPALAKPNVTLETRPIQRITPTGVDVDTSKPNPTVTEDTNLDVLILATGFQTMQFLGPINFTGRNGRKLDDIWANGPRALNGVTVEDLPNFGMMYGPNTNLGHSSIVLMLEAQSRYIAGLAGAVMDARKFSRNPGGSVPQAFGNDVTTGPKLLTLTPTRDAVERYEKEMQARLADSPFADPNCSSWYKDPTTGKITNNWPGDCREFGTRLSKVEWSDYEGGEEVQRMRRGQKKADVGRVKEDLIVSDWMVVGSVVVSALAGGVGWYLRRGRGLVVR